MNRSFLRFGILVAAAVFDPSWANADVFGSGANAFTMDFVTVGNPGNAADSVGRPSGIGTVNYAYRIGSYEVSEQMIDKANALGALGITKNTRGPNKPATNISWFEAAQFVNWLNTSTGATPAYKFDGMGNFQAWAPADAGYDASKPFRSSLARYYLPSINEWYKAAYYDPAAGVYYQYPTGSDTPPTPVAGGTAAGTVVADQFLGPSDVTQAGGLSPYGTMAQGGNVAEWNETNFAVLGPPDIHSRGVRGGGANSSILEAWSLTVFGDGTPQSVFATVGFRVARAIPEPASSLLSAVVVMSLHRVRGRRRRPK